MNTVSTSPLAFIEFCRFLPSFPSGLSAKKGLDMTEIELLMRSDSPSFALTSPDAERWLRFGVSKSQKEERLKELEFRGTNPLDILKGDLDRFEEWLVLLESNRITYDRAVYLPLIESFLREARARIDHFAPPIDDLPSSYRQTAQTLYERMRTSVYKAADSHRSWRKEARYHSGVTAGKASAGAVGRSRETLLDVHLLTQAPRDLAAGALILYRRPEEILSVFFKELPILLGSLG